MPDFPFGTVVDPRDVTQEADAEQVRVDVWEGVSAGWGGSCTTYATPIERLSDVLAWQRSHAGLHVDVGVTARLNGEVHLISIVRTAAGPDERGEGQR